MKKYISFLTIALLIGTVNFAQHHSKIEWKELKDFHAVMGATFHPSEKGDYNPIKKRSGELADKATAWSKSDYPKGYDQAVIAPILEKLVLESKTLDTRVKEGASDAEIGKLLGALHDRFHEIVEKCSSSEHEKQ